MNEPNFKAISLKDFEKTAGVATLVDSKGDTLSSLTKERNSAIEKVASTNMMMQDPYPSAFLSLSDTNIPDNMTELFKWCKYFYMFDPLIGGAINSLSTFPITSLYMDESEKEEANNIPGESDTLKTYRRVILKELDLHKLLISIGIDYFLYGNCFIFGEFKTNTQTGEREWKHVTRLDPSKIIIDVNEATQERKYKMEVSDKTKRIVRSKQPLDEYNKIPEIIKKAVDKNEAVVLNPNNIYHISRPSDSMGDSAWGVPAVVNVIKLLMYRNVLRRAQEAIAREHIVPFRIYYFERTENYNTQGDWNGVPENFAAELNKASRDPNYKVISPVPVNVLNLGGNGKSLMLTPEIEQVQGEILAGLNIPREFIFGGVSWSGSSISLKILENQFITYRILIKNFIQNFLIKGMAKERGEWVDQDDDNSLVSITMADLKMQDDVQQKQLIVNLNGAGKVTDEIMWKAMGLDPEKMRVALDDEVKKKVELESEIKVLQIKAETKVQMAHMLEQIKLKKFQKKLERMLIESPDPSDRDIAIDEDQEQMAGQAMAPEQEMPHQEEQQEGKEQEDNSMPIDITPDKIYEIASKLASMKEEERNEAIQTIPQEYRDVILSQMKAIINTNEQGDSGRGYMDAQKIALDLLKINENQREPILANMPPSLRTKVVTLLNSFIEEQERAKAEMQEEYEDEQSQEIDMRPLPEQRPPRRDSMK